MVDGSSAEALGDRLTLSGYLSTIFVIVVIVVYAYLLGLGGQLKEGGGSHRHRTTMTNYYLNHACYYNSKFQFRNYYMRTRVHKEKGRR